MQKYKTRPAGPLPSARRGTGRTAPGRLTWLAFQFVLTAVQSDTGWVA